MHWDKEAKDIVEAIPLPPMIAHYAKMDAERRARQQAVERVTPDIARETEKGYEKALGRQAVELLRAMARGEDVQLPDEFFVEEPHELYSIQLCPAQYGASTMEKREQMRRLLVPLRKKLKQLDITGILMDKVQTSIMSHHLFRIGITGCPNACFSPYFLDFGALGVYRPGARDTGCTQCGECVAYCSENAISLEDGGPVFDMHTCVKCGGCPEVCDQNVIFTEKAGYKVVAGGVGSRHPHIARTVTECTDLDGVLSILEKAVIMIRDTPVESRVITFHDIIEKNGIEKLRP